ncbi:MAG: hypothetical protein EOM44_02985 [Bacteroidia bacterium]|nr:hypothetical protein [Bacteroidia bacterium]
MKKSIISFVLLVIFISIANRAEAQNVYVLQNGSRVLFFSALTNVMGSIQDGDTLYLPPKPIDASLTINKRVAIIGAGYHPDTSKVTGITKVTGEVVFAKKSRGSSMTGVRTEGRVLVQDSSITVTRCNMQYVEVTNGATPISQVYFGDCVIRDVVRNFNDVVTNALIERCIIGGQIEGGNKTNNLMIKNCVLLSDGNYFMSSITNLIIQNSIILCTNGFGFLYSSSSFTLKNNLFVRGEFSIPSFSMTGNIFGIPRADIFVDESKGDYRIKPTLTQAFTMATDGKQVGIYGTDYPFLVPTYAPRFTAIDNAESVVDGKLSVKMKVEARNR